jgi:hypothetical protein
MVMPLEILWDHILSRQPDLVNDAFQSLGEDDRAVVLEHLKKMATEPGWHAEQRISAQVALTVLGSTPND